MFDRRHGRIASYGLPPRDGFEAMQAALADWRGGRTSWEHWGEASESARAGIAPRRGRRGEHRRRRLQRGADEQRRGRRPRRDRRHGARTLLDATQACGWMPIDAGRFDTSPAWCSWVGRATGTRLDRIGVDAVYAHDVALANRFRAGLGMEPSNSAIVSVADEGAAQRLERAGIVAALRGGRMRASWHLYNTEQDVDAALDALAARGRRACSRQHGGGARFADRARGRLTPRWRSRPTQPSLRPCSTPATARSCWSRRTRRRSWSASMTR